MGYRPWDRHPSGAPLRELHRACVNLMRADYGGDNHPTTRDGTPVDIEDRFGIQTFDHVEGMSFEAAWGAKGALCVARPRIENAASLDVLAELYPGLTLGPDLCTRDAFRGNDKALLFNRSYPRRD